MYNILVCDDDKEIVEAIEIYLSQEGYHVLKAYDGAEALKMLESQEVHLLVLDVMMPRLDGIRATLKIRENNSIPIIILSAKSEDADKILGLNVGADDYVTKPFNIEILHKKINVILKRNTKNTFYKDDHLFFDKNTSKLVIDNKEIKLTPLEFKLLSLFLENQNQIILKETIIEKIWDSNENYVDEHTLLVNISRLRNKIEDDKHHYIKTVYGLGYRWCHDE